jgi:hypothetical protein
VRRRITRRVPTVPTHTAAPRRLLAVGHHATMLQALAWAVRTTRKASEVPRHVIALDAGVSPATIGRFERAEAWPWDPECIVNAVAARADLQPSEVWQAAVNALTKGDHRL